MKMSHNGWEPTVAPGGAWEIHAPEDSPGMVTLTLRTIPARRAAGVVEALNINAARELRDDLTAAINAAATAAAFARAPYIRAVTDYSSPLEVSHGN